MLAMGRKKPSIERAFRRFGRSSYAAKNVWIAFLLAARLCLQVADGANLVPIDAGALAVELLEFVEARVLVEVRGVDSLDFAAVVEGDQAWGGAASQGGEGAEQQGGQQKLFMRYFLEI